MALLYMAIINFIMRKPTLLYFLPIIFLSVHCFTAIAQPRPLENAQFQIELLKNAAVSVKHKRTEKVLILQPRFTVMKRVDDPMLRFRVSSRTKKITPQANDNIYIPTWEKKDAHMPFTDFFEVAKPAIARAASGKVQLNTIEWRFPANDRYSITATLSLTEGIDEPVISFTFIPKKDGYYSIGYTGMPEIAEEQTDAVWQPYVWQGKRFPEKSFLSTEDMCSLPGTMVEKGGMTYGLLADPSVIPYRLPYQPKGNVGFGVLVRNQKGNAQPMVFAPVLGNKDSRLAPGKAFSFKLRILLFEGSQPDAFLYAATNIFGFKDYRKNVFTNLNQTIENMIDFQMDDVYGKWNNEMKGSDYSTDVKQTVKNVSGLHPLSVSVITDNKGIYTRRALPMIEYLISREKYLFTINKDITDQQPSSKMAGPAIPVSELATLNIFYRNQSPVFKYFADSLSHITRQLNLTKDSKGDSWPNLLALYRMTGDTAYLKRCVQKADEYIEQQIAHKPTDFSEASTAQSAMFWTDYAPLWMELLNLYEETGEKKYLDASAEGARLYMQYVWFCPVIPDSSIMVNEKGIVDFRCGTAIVDNIPAMAAPPQKVPAWRVSQIGLTPEASNTLSANAAIFLTNYAPYLLRLAYYTNNDFFRAVARAAVVGRYTNYPGYTITGEFNTIYSRPDYPLRYQHEVSYNQFYYNHVWPQIAMLFDYLISDVYVSSKRKISFPGEFAEGYAYIKSNVYGFSTGRFYNDRDVHLWMPKQVLKINNEQVNYLTGYGNNKFYIALLNQSNDALDIELKINPDLVPINPDGINTARSWADNRPTKALQVINGTANIHISPKGITALAIDDVPVTTQFQQDVFNATEAGAHDETFKIVTSSFRKISSAIFSFGKLSNAYIWLEASGQQVKKAVLHYHISGAKDWGKKEDNSYPFEFSIPLEEKAAGIKWWIEVTHPTGQTNKSTAILLQK